MISHEGDDLVSLEELRSVLAAYAGPDNPREYTARHRLGRLRPVLVVAVVTGALAGAGVAIAAGLGAFNGISAAQQTQVGVSVLDPAALATIKQNNATMIQYNKAHAADLPVLQLDTARVLGRMPDGSPVYGLTDQHGDLCTLGEVGGGCGPPLSRSHPITDGFFNASPTTGGKLVASGVAMDGVTAVSFTVSGQPVTVPVTNNIWTYTEANSHADGADCIIAHFADGSTVNAFPEVPCP